MSPSFRSALRRWGVVILPGIALYFAPFPGLDATQRHLLAFFVTTIIALIARPVPMGVSVVTVMTLLALTGTLSAEAALSGFGSSILWLVFTAFVFARAVSSTRLGMRIAYFLISRFGHTSLTLGYSIALSDLALAPLVPSDTARGGGVFAPIIRSLAEALDSEPGPTANRIGSYLTLVGYHCTYAASAMFLTSMAANPLIASFARSIAHVDITWGRWALAACVPGICTFAMVPWLVHQLNPPDLGETEHARVFAKEKLRAMGPMQRREGILVITMLCVMAGWITSPWHGISNTIVALAGVCALLLTGVLKWDDIVGNVAAWDALIWFAPLFMMAEQLSAHGVMTVLTESLFRPMHGLPWVVALAALVLVYVYAHYAFASMTAHVTALFPGFLGIALAAGVPPMLAPIPFAFLSSLNAGLTHYGTGSAPVYFSLGYVSQGTWWTVGLVVVTTNLAIWIGVGLLWWRVLGFW